MKGSLPRRRINGPRLEPAAFTTRQVTAIVAMAFVAVLLWPVGASAGNAFLNVFITDPTNTSAQAHVTAAGQLQVAGSVAVTNTPTVGIDASANTVKIDPSANTVKVDTSNPVPVAATATEVIASAGVLNHDFTQSDLTLLSGVDVSGARSIRLLATATCEEGNNLTCPNLWLDIYTTAGGVTYLLDSVTVASSLTFGESDTVTKVEELPGTNLTIVVPSANPVHDQYDVSVAIVGRAN